MTGPVEQVSDVEGLVARLERTQTYLDEADARVDLQRKEIAEDAKRIGELERCLETAIAVIDRSGIIWMGDTQARAVLNGDNAQWLIDRENEMLGVTALNGANDEQV